MEQKRGWKFAINCGWIICEVWIGSTRNYHTDGSTWTSISKNQPSISRISCAKLLRFEVLRESGALQDKKYRDMAIRRAARGLCNRRYWRSEVMRVDYNLKRMRKLICVLSCRKRAWKLRVMKTNQKNRRINFVPFCFSVFCSFDPAASRSLTASADDTPLTPVLLSWRPTLE